jgi:type I restriction enzyme, S subunit
MTLNLDKSSWDRVSLGMVAQLSKEKVDPTDGSVERYVAGEHMATDELQIQGWGNVGEVDLGPAFHRRFRPGQVLYGSRRTYLRKVAVADFDGVCANTTFVVETKDSGVLLQEFLPFVMTSEPFHAFAIAESKGSVNPYVNWSDIERFEFDLPLLDEQQRLADLLWAIESRRVAMQNLVITTTTARSTWLHSLFARAETTTGLVGLDSMVDARRPICYGVLKPGPEFEGGPLLVDVKDYPSGRIHLHTVRRCSPVIEAGFKRSRLRTGDVLLSIRGTIGRVAVVPEQLDGQNVSRDSARISGDPTKILPDFLRLILESPDVQEEIRRTTTGLAVKGINVARIRTLQVPNWTIERQQEAVNTQGQIGRTLDTVSDELIALSMLRTSLLVETFGGS